MKKILLLMSLICTLCWSSAFAADEEQQIPEQVIMSHWACKQIAELAKQYDASKKLPETLEVNHRTISKAELAKYLLSVMEKMVEKCDLEGKHAVHKEDLERVGLLHDALKEELTKYEGYQTQREAIETMLAKPDTPVFEYKLGLNGFLRGEGAGNFHLTDFSYTPQHSEGRFVYRVKPYAYWHPTDYLDFHIEGQGFGYIGERQEFSRYSLYQGFAETRIPGSDLLALKAGRQEFVYGSAFILGNDTFNDGLIFDALRLRITPVDKLAIDLLGGWYAQPFANGVKGNLVGSYATWTFSEGNTLEAYGFRDIGSEDHHKGEHRDTWGIRGTAKFGPIALEIEPVYQTGRLYNSADGRNEDIKAYGGHADVSVDGTAAGYHNHLFLSYALGSGAGDAVTGISSRKEFSTPNTDSSLFGDMQIIGGFGADLGDHHASGLQIFTIGWGVDFTKELNFSATGHYFLANHVEDNFSRNIGLETDFALTYALNDNLSIIAGYDHFFTGRFFRNAAMDRSDIHYGYMMLEFDISHMKPKFAAQK